MFQSLCVSAYRWYRLQQLQMVFMLVVVLPSQLKSCTDLPGTKLVVGSKSQWERLEQFQMKNYGAITSAAA